MNSKIKANPNMNKINVLGILTVVFTGLSFLEPSFYLADLLNSFRLQFLVFLFAVSFLNLFYKKLLNTLFFIGFSLLNFAVIAPHIFPSKELEKHELKIYYSNVLRSNTSYAKLLSRIMKTNPDIIGLVEVNSEWANNIESLKEKYSYLQVLPIEGSFGLALYSKYKLENVQTVQHSSGVPSFYAKVIMAKKNLNIFLTHPHPPISKKLWSKRNQQIKEISVFLSKIEGNIFVFGDFNSVSWTSHLKEPFRQSNLKEITSLYNTWPSFLFPPFRISIDHAYASRNLIGSKKILKSIGSDHLPILYQLNNLKN